MDQLTKIYPYDSPVQLKVKSLVNFLTQDLNFFQIQRLEALVELVVERKMSIDEFIRMLQKKYAQGGVDLPKNLAEHMGHKVEKVLNQSEDARRFRRRFLANNFFDRENVLIKRLTKYLIDEYQGEFSHQQKLRVRDLVYKRVAGLISRRDFKNSLRTSIEDGGVGVTINASRLLTRYFEKILILGSETKGHGH
jgi:hypothetical protein